MRNIVGIVKPIGGLGNRLKSLVSALRFTNKVYTTDRIFNLLFKKQFPVVNEYQGKCLEFSDWRFRLKESDPVNENFGTVYLQCCSAKEQSRYAIDFEYFRIPEVIRSEIASIFSMLEPSTIIQQAVARFTEDWSKDVIAVHVRSWIDDPIRRAALYNLEAYFREIDRRNASMRIFLATDSMDVTSEFVKKYGDRVLFHPYGAPNLNPHVSESETDETAIKAFVDMLCLSKGELLIGTYLSTFTECAWWYGGCKQHVIII
jgi:hypothetical protein